MTRRAPLASSLTLALTFTLTFLCGTNSLAGPQSLDALPRAAAPGWFTSAPDGVLTAERFELNPGVVALLAATQTEATVRLADWPTAPGVRATVRLTRHDVYAADARVLVVGPDGATEAPRSRLVFLWGEADDEAGSRVLAVADPDDGTLTAYIGNEDGWNEIRPVSEADGTYVVAEARSLLGVHKDLLIRDCASGSLPVPARNGIVANAPIAPAPGSPEGAVAGTLRQTLLAFDTDNELLLQKFSDNTISATNYIASLTALMSTLYERDLSLRVLQGTTILRPSTTTDPWLQSGTGNADSAKLDEFNAYWQANHNAVPRGAAMLLSGKQANPYGSSGIASVDALCSKTRGYSFVQVFKYSGSTASSDLMVSAHELGHNLGSRHTHCYLTPTPIDTCYNGEGGCYSGTTSCPAPQTINGVTNVRGTLMSYCHQLSGCSVATVLHPRTVALLDPLVDQEMGVCVNPASAPQEASPSGDMLAARGTGSNVTLTFSPACGASGHTVYAGNLATLASAGIAWNQRFCGFGTTGSATFNPGAGNSYFVVVANNGAVEGSYGQTSAGLERPAAGPGGACSYPQQLGGSCP